VNLTVGRRRTTGQTLVEFAIVLPFLLMVFFGVIEFGRYIYSSETVTNAAREAARLAVVNQDADLIQRRAADNAVGLGLAAPDPNPETGTSDVTVAFPDCEPSALGIGCEVSVRVRYSFGLITPLGPLFAVACHFFGGCSGSGPTVRGDIISVTTMPIEFVCPNRSITDATMCPRQP
jgi:hypothetical protein